MTDKKSFMINRQTRSTEMGAYDKSYLYSIRQQKELQPHRQRSSKTGNHGTDTWFLLSGTYYQCSASFSNSGKGGWQLVEFVISDDGTETMKDIDNPPDWLSAIIPNQASKELFPIPYD